MRGSLILHSSALYKTSCHLFHSRSAHHTVPRINARAAVEVEELRSRFLTNDLQRRKIPGLSGDLDPQIGLSVRNHHRVQAPAHAAHSPELLHPLDQSR